MKPTIRTLGEILYSPSQYVIPVFQRNYRWEHPQWEKLWEDLLEIQAANKTGNHFMGFLVFVPGLPQPGVNTTFHLVDGQQRLTTSSIILGAVRNVAQKAGNTDLAEEIHDYYLVHPKKPGEQRFRLLPKDSDRNSYLALVDSLEIPGGRVANALSFFEERISTYAASKPDGLRHVFNTVCQRFEFMCATLEAENAYSIFKSLNSTGVPLGPADLIRNFVYMHLRPEEHDEFDRQHWQSLEKCFTHANSTLDGDRFSKFFRDFLMSIKDFGYVAPGATFERFENHYEATNFSPNQLAIELKRHAKHNEIISGKEPDQNSAVTQALAGLNQLESSTTYPLLLALFELRRQNSIDSEQLAQAINMVSSFILRRFICDESSRGYGPMFVRAVAELLEVESIKSLEVYLIQRGWPDDRRFEAAFVEFPLYKRGYTRQVLMALEQHRGHKEPADLAKTQIEHILPQTLTDAWREELGENAESIHVDWLHRPGNLTLSAYNPELQNSPFQEKRKRYKDSHIDLTRELTGYEHWTVIEIAARGQVLATEAAQIWAGPPSRSTAASTSAIDIDSDTSGMSAARQLQLDFWTGFAQHLQSQTGWKIRRKPQAQHWMDIPIGRSNFVMNAFINSRAQRIGVGLALYGPDKQAYFQQLYAQKDEIETEIGEPLTWQALPAKKSSYISLSKADTNPMKPDLWPEQYQWLIDKLKAYDLCFRDRVQNLAVGS